MSRLKKIAENLSENFENQEKQNTTELNKKIDDLDKEKDFKNSEGKILLTNILNSSKTMTDQLKQLIESINELSKNNTDIYNEFKKIVKLPNENQIQDFVKLSSDIEEAIKMFSDNEFLSSITKE